MAIETSLETGRIPSFSTVDYVVFGLLLALSASVGLYYAIKDKIQKKENTTEFLLGGRSMSVIPVAVSLSVTFQSALTILGNPAEMYNYNTMYNYVCLAMILSMVGAGLIFIPFFYRLKITSVFQYLEMRFDYSVRWVGSVLLVFQSLLYMSFVLYSPCLALSAVTGLDLWGCVIGLGGVVTLYTMLGGMKAVLWTDTLQFVVMFVGMMAVFIQGSIEAGGFSKAWNLMDRRGRIVFDDGDPRTRHSFWSVVVGSTFMWTALYGVNQAQVQRCLSTGSVRKAQLAILLNTPGLIFTIIFTGLIGVVMFSFYAECDPIKFGIVTKSDQFLPLFVMDILSDRTGLPGIFVSCVFSGSLSSLSSALNAVSTVAYKDFIQPFCCTKMSEARATLLNKGLVLLIGATCIGLAYVVSKLGNVLQASITVYGLLNGPLFGLFVLGMFFPWANKWGALTGAITSLAIMLWIGIGAFVLKASTAVRSPISTAGCNWNVTQTLTTTAATFTTTATTASTFMPVDNSDDDDDVLEIYKLSYLYYTVTGMVISLVTGLIVSFITGYTRPSTLDPRYICPIFDVLLPCLPECILRPLRFGIDHKGKYDKYGAEDEDDTDSDVGVKEKGRHVNGNMAPADHSIQSGKNGIDNVAYIKEPFETKL